MKTLNTWSIAINFQIFFIFISARLTPEQTHSKFWHNLGEPHKSHKNLVSKYKTGHSMVSIKPNVDHPWCHQLPHDSETPHQALSAAGRVNQPYNRFDDGWLLLYRWKTQTSTDLSYSTVFEHSSSYISLNLSLYTINHLDLIWKKTLE